MPLLLVAIALIAAAILFSRGRAWGRGCRWRVDPSRRQGALQRYVCQACGADAFTSTGQPPVDCKRAYRPRG